MECKNCGAPLRERDTFCGRCGAKVERQSPASVGGAYDPAQTQTHRNGGSAGAEPYYDSYEDAYAQQPYGGQQQAAYPAYGYDDPADGGQSAPSGGNGLRAALIALIVFLALLLTSFVVFNVLLITHTIDVSGSDFLEDYRDSLFELLNISEEEDKDTQDGEEKITGWGMIDETPSVTSPSTTSPYVDTTTTPPSVTTTAPDTTTAADPQNSIPAELQPYEAKLTTEGRTYRITLQEDDWNINYRSAPVLIDPSKSENNILGKLRSGAEIYVEYIYDGKWAVFYKDGQYVFASLYASNDPSKNRLMEAM